MKHFVIILVLLLAAAPARAKSWPEFMNGISSFIVCSDISQESKKIDLDKSDLEYFVIQKFQSAGLEVVNEAQKQFDGKRRDGNISVCVVIFHDEILGPRVYYYINLKISRFFYITELKKWAPVVIYFDAKYGYSPDIKLKPVLNDSLNDIISAFITDWRSVNKYIQTPTGVRFVLPSTNDPYAGIATPEK